MCCGGRILHFIHSFHIQFFVTVEEKKAIIKTYVGYKSDKNNNE